MLSKSAYIFGIILIVLGILGLITQMFTFNIFYGYYVSNTVLSLLLIISGLLALWSAYGRFFAEYFYPRRFFKFFGFIFGIIGVLGFWYDPFLIYNLIANSYYNSIIFSSIGFIMLYLGFGYRGG